MLTGVMEKSQQSKQEFYGVKRETGEPADQRAVEADVLQIPADVDFDQRNQLPHVPGLDLIGNESRNAAFLVGDETPENGDEALVDLGAQLGIAGQRLASLHEHARQMLLQHLGLSAGAAFDERARV